MGDDIQEKISGRGFLYYDPVITEQGEKVHIYESSACVVEGDDRGPWLWLKIEGTAHVDEDAEIEVYSPATWVGKKRIPPTRIVKGDMSAHLDIRKAEAVHARLGRMIEHIKKSWGIEP